jgi:hypothetical protein
MTAYPVINQKVICIRTRNSSKPRTYPENFPVLYGIYTIREIEIVSGRPVIRLHEIKNEKRMYNFGGVPKFAEVAFGAYAFRPLDESKLDQFRALLNPTDQEAAEFTTFDRVQERV